LQTLDLSGTKVTDVELKDLAELKNVQLLDLSHTPVTDAGLKDLAGLENLQSLDLSSTNITDAGLMHLKRLKKLWWLSLRNTQVTDAGIKALKEALPGLVVDSKMPELDLPALPRLDSPAPSQHRWLIWWGLAALGAAAAGAYARRKKS
jgi:MYXO-CTERM domain-containing protein